MKQKPDPKHPGKPEIKPPTDDKTEISAGKPFLLDLYMEKYGLWVTFGLVAFLILVVFQKFIAGNAYGSQGR